MTAKAAKRKPGRPRLPESEKLGYDVRLALTRDDHRAIVEEADRKGLTPTQYCRMVVVTHLRSVEQHSKK
jgi:hypothetical protein